MRFALEYHQKGNVTKSELWKKIFSESGSTKGVRIIATSIVTMNTSIVTMNTIIPIFRQFFAIFGEFSLMAKYKINPPIMPKIIGTRYHHLLSDSGTIDDLPGIDLSCSFTNLPQCVHTSASGEDNSLPHLEQNVNDSLIFVFN